MLRSLLILASLLPLFAFAQETVGLGQWRSYQSQAGAMGAAYVAGYAVKLSDIGLVTLEVASGEVRELSKATGLYSSRPTAVYGDAARGELVVGYSDGVFDRWADDGAQLSLVRRTFDIQRSAYLSKAVRCAYADAGTLYLGTDFGLVAFTAAGVPRFTTAQFATALPERAVRAIGRYGSRLYVLTPDGVFSATASGVNLADAASWRAEHGSLGLPATGLTQLATTTGRVLALANDVLYEFRGATWTAVPEDVAFIGPMTSLQAAGQYAVGIRNRSTVVLRDDRAGAVQLMGSPRAAALDAATARTVIADAEQGLVVAMPSFTQGFSTTERSVSFALPSNGCRQIAVNDGVLYVAPTGHTGRYQPGFSETGVYAFTKRTSSWQVFNRANGGLDNSVYLDLGAVCVDPTKNRVTFASWMQGLVVFENGQRKEVLYNANAPIPGLLFNPTTGYFDRLYIGGCAVDRNGALWVSSFDALPPVAVRNAAGQWANVPFVATRPLEIVVDRANRKWFMLADQNLAVIDDRDQPTNTAVHRRRLLTPTAGQGALPGIEVLAVAEDRDGQIWLGSSQGVGVFYNPSATVTGSAGGDAQCPVIDGRCLLRDERVQTIAVDGANRKWIGTTRGLFMVSPEGTAVLARYTEANSPLVSDDVRDLAFDGTTGELFIATDLGIVSLRTDASEPLEAAALRVFPNPARLGDDTPITVLGLTEGSVVQVTTASGERVQSLTANGGTAVWNGKYADGRRAAPGVYLIVAAKPDGSGEGVTKVAVVDR
jgi:hypothetical protein